MAPLASRRPRPRAVSAPPASRTRYAILGLLADGPRSGYDIKKEVGERIAHFWNESLGNLYPVLRAMTEDGLVTRSDDARSARARAVYRITPAGRRRLEAWLREPVVASPPRLEILLKVYFGAHTDPAVLIAHVAAYRAERASQLAMLERVHHELRATGRSSGLRYLRLTVAAGVHAAKAAIAWCDEALAELDPRT
jgi:PadR family transcriptional regulator, regulatory protein AphA